MDQLKAADSDEVVVHLTRRELCKILHYRTLAKGVVDVLEEALLRTEKQSRAGEVSDLKVVNLRPKKVESELARNVRLTMERQQQERIAAKEKLEAEQRRKKAEALKKRKEKYLQGEFPTQVLAFIRADKRHPVTNMPIIGITTDELAAAFPDKKPSTLRFVLWEFKKSGLVYSTNNKRSFKEGAKPLVVWEANDFVHVTAGGDDREESETETGIGSVGRIVSKGDTIVCEAVRRAGS